MGLQTQLIYNCHKLNNFCTGILEREYYFAFNQKQWKARERLPSLVPYSDTVFICYFCSSEWLILQLQHVLLIHLSEETYIEVIEVAGINLRYCKLARSFYKTRVLVNQQTLADS